MQKVNNTAQQPSTTITQHKHHQPENFVKIRSSQSRQQQMTLTQQITAASAGAALTTVVVTPFDVIKTQMQVNRALAAPHMNPTTLNSIKYVIQSSGVKGLWRGITPSLIMQIPGTGLYYSIYEHLKQYMNTRQAFSEDGKYRIYSPLIAGCFARICATFATSPLEFARTVAQSSLSDGRSSAKQFNLGSLARLVQKRQVSPWTGLSVTLLRDAPFSALYWFVYEQVKDTLMSSNSGGNDQIFTYAFLSGAVSGMISAVVTNPIDVIKSEIQSKGMIQTENQSIWATTRSLYAEGGLRSFSKGIVPRTVKVAPACAIMISSYEIFKSLYHDRYI